MKHIFIFLTLMAPLVSQAKNSCFVDVDLACVPPSNANQIVFKTMTWTRKSTAARAALFNSIEVQNNPAACLSFAHMMKTECAIATPIATVFTTGVAKPIISAIAIGFDTDKYCRAPHSKSFRNYFNQPAATGVTTAARICGRAKQGALTIFRTLLQY
ncbi:MAG: hypothetical protein ACAH59_03385 [Pseudobdellovibrionaceae bacterium]